MALENTYERLLKAAIELMNKKGYPGTSIGMLAQKVGISRSTVMHYFKSKEGMLLTVLENFLPPYLEELKTVINDEHMDGLAKLRWFLHFHMKPVGERREVLVINLHDTKFLTGENKQIFQNQQRAYEGLIVRIVNQIQEEGSGLFQGMEPKIVAKAILGMVNHTTVWYREGGPHSLDGVAEIYYSMLTKGCLNSE